MTSETKEKCPECGSTDLVQVRKYSHIFAYISVCNNCGWHEK